MVDDSRKFPAKGDQLLGAVYRDFLSRNRLLEYIEACDEMDYQNSLSSWLQFALKVVELFCESKALDIGRLKNVELLDKKLDAVLAEITNFSDVKKQLVQDKRDTASELRIAKNQIDDADKKIVALKDKNTDLKNELSDCKYYAGKLVDQLVRYEESPLNWFIIKYEERKYGRDGYLSRAVDEFARKE